MKKALTLKKIISASRMCDMPKFYPNDIILECTKQFEKGVKLHTLVLWTKFVDSLLTEPLKSFITKIQNEKSQVFFEITITGMGGEVIGQKKNGDWKIEPNVLNYELSLKLLEQLVNFISNPDLIKIRIDPIIKVRDINKKLYTNLNLIETILKFTTNLKIKDYTFSLLEPNVYFKVDKRFKEIGCEIVKFNDKERESLKKLLKYFEKKYDIKFYACCVDGFLESACIDGIKLTKLHPLKEPCSLYQPRKRKMCGCVDSYDIVGWPIKKCFAGCDYCYANPYYVN